MLTLPKIDPIDYLVKRKFPNFRLIESEPSLSPRRRHFLAEYSPHALEPAQENITPQYQKMLEEVNSYREKLSALPDAEIQKRYRDEVAKKQAEDDQERFFNDPGADADFDYWSKMVHWRLDEAIALSFGKSSEIVSWERLEKIPYWVSPFASEYSRTRELALRAVTWDKLFDPVLPTIFVGWAKDTDIPIPDELVEMVEARSGKLIDWKKKYDELLVEGINSLKTANRLLVEKNMGLTQITSSSTF